MRSDSASTRDDLLSVRLDNMDSSLLELSLTNETIHNDVFEKYYHINASDASHVNTIAVETDLGTTEAPPTTTIAVHQQPKKIGLTKAPSISERLNILHLSRGSTYKILPMNSLDDTDDTTLDSPGLVKPTVVPSELEEKLHLLQRRNNTTVISSPDNRFELQKKRSPAVLSPGGSLVKPFLTMRHPIGSSGEDIEKAHRKPTITLIHRLKKLSKDTHPVQDTTIDVPTTTGALLDSGNKDSAQMEIGASLLKVPTADL